MPTAELITRAVGSTGIKSDINVTPLVDVMLVLLVIFMVTAPLLHQGVEVKLPKSVAQNLPKTPEGRVGVGLAGVAWGASGHGHDLDHPLWTDRAVS